MILPFCVIKKGVKIGVGCEVGPFTHLRPGTVLEDGAEVGNFTEMKNTVLGSGSKAKHLSYLGDGVIGKDVNIGAGTITCNYDGIRKNKTEIGDEVFLGSDSLLIAPVSVGDRSATGAGSIINRDVPPDTAAVGAPARHRPKKQHPDVAATQ